MRGQLKPDNNGVNLGSQIEPVGSEFESLEKINRPDPGWVWIQKFLDPTGSNEDQKVRFSTGRLLWMTPYLFKNKINPIGHSIHTN